MKLDNNSFVETRKAAQVEKVGSGPRLAFALEATRPELCIMTRASPVAATAEAEGSRWRVLGIACLAHVLHDGYSSMIYLLLPSWQAEFALSLTQVGVLKTLYSAAMAVGQVPAGRLGERLGEKLPLATGTLLTAIAVLALHWATTPLFLGLLLIAGGLGASVQHPLSSTLISRSYGGSTLRMILGTYNFAGDLGKAAIPGLLTVLIAAFGWRIGTEMISMLGVATAAILLITLRSAQKPRVARDMGRSAVAGPPLPEPVRRRGFAALSVIGILDSATRTGLLTLLPFTLAHKEADGAVIGTALSLVFAGGAAGKFACGALASRIGILRTVVLTKGGTAFAILLLVILPLPFGLGLMPVLGMALNGTSSVLYGTVPELAPRDRHARAFGFFYTVTIGADAIAPTLYGTVADIIGLTGSLLLVAVINLVGLPLLTVLRPALQGRTSVIIPHASTDR
jgi:MFS transporter, FSR family, fosmidomycin resistance protein